MNTATNNAPETDDAVPCDFAAAFRSDGAEGGLDEYAIAGLAVLNDTNLFQGGRYVGPELPLYVWGQAPATPAYVAPVAAPEAPEAKPAKAARKPYQARTWADGAR